MRTVYKVRIVPDAAPDAMTEKAVLVKDLAVPIEVALGRLGAASDEDLAQLHWNIAYELLRRGKDVY